MTMTIQSGLISRGENDLGTVELLPLNEHVCLIDPEGVVTQTPDV